MNKVELEAKVDGLNDEINFLRILYAAVRPPSPHSFKEGTLPLERQMVGIHRVL